jgi:hypothetical protein
MVDDASKAHAQAVIDSAPSVGDLQTAVDLVDGQALVSVYRRWRDAQNEKWRGGLGRRRQLYDRSRGVNLSVDLDLFRDTSQQSGVVEYDYLFKFILIGDRGSGVTTLLNRFVENSNDFPSVPSGSPDIEFKVRLDHFPANQNQLTCSLPEDRDMQRSDSTRNEDSETSDLGPTP